MDLRTMLSSTLAVSLVVAGITATKIAQFVLPLFGPVTVPAGFIGIGVGFLVTDLLSELYGRDAAQTAVNAAIATLAVGWTLVYASILMPAAPFYPLAGEFAAVLGAGGTIIVASIITLLVSQNLDVAAFHAIDNRVPYKWARNIGSTVVSQLLDTALFITLAFVVFPSLVGGQSYPLAVAIELIVAQYVVKLIVVAADTPLFYLVSGLADRKD